MQFEIDRDTLLKPLQAIIGVVERRQTLPVLANVLVVADDKGLSFTATDLEVEIQARVNIPVDEGGQITLPARKLVDITRSLAEDSVLKVSVDKDRAILRSGRSRFALTTLPAGDFPVVDDIGVSEGLEVSRESLRWLIERTHFSMALQDVRYYLNGLLLEIESTRVRAVATDGHRLALATMGVADGPEEPRQVIVPRKGVQELLRLLGGDQEIVTLYLGANHVRLGVSDLRFTSKLIDGRFPDYQRVIPALNDTPVRLSRDDLRQALSRVSILSNEKYRGIRFSVSGEQLSVQSNNPEQEEAEEELGVSYQGDDVDIGFNASYMLDALGAIEQPEVEIYLTDGNSSALVRGEGVEDCRYVVMPMRL